MELTAQGVTVPRLGFGTWELSGQTAYDAVGAALSIGYRHIDTAQMYGNEEEVGRAVRESDVPRDEIFVTTKVTPGNAKADDVRSSTDESLRTLGLDHVDLLLIHWPTDTAPIEETLGAMDELREAGKTRLIGVSNYTSDLLRRAADAAPIANNQVEYHPFLDQSEVLDTIRELGLFLTAYSPLAKGKAIGHETLTSIAEGHGVGAAAVAIRWLLSQDDVVAIPRSSSRDHIEANFTALDIELSDEELARIDDLPKDRRQIDPPFAPDWD